MGIKLIRNKKRNILLSIIYRIQKLLPLNNERKFKLFLNLEWIFDRLSHEMSIKNYEASQHPGRKKKKKTILSNIKETSIVLDLGCNSGDISSFIAEIAKEVVGIDYNKKAIEAAKQKYKKDNLFFYHGEALEYLNNNEKKFDILILSHILEHLDNPEDFLKKFKDHFREIYIEVPDFDRYYLNLYRQEKGLELIYSDEDHVSEFDRDELKLLLDACGITINKAEYRYGMQKLWCSTK